MIVTSQFFLTVHFLLTFVKRRLYWYFRTIDGFCPSFAAGEGRFCFPLARVGVAFLKYGSNRIGRPDPKQKERGLQDVQQAPNLHGKSGHCHGPADMGWPDLDVVPCDRRACLQRDVCCKGWKWDFTQYNKAIGSFINFLWTLKSNCTVQAFYVRLVGSPRAYPTFEWLSRWDTPKGSAAMTRAHQWGDNAAVKFWGQEPHLERTVSYKQIYSSEGESHWDDRIGDSRSANIKPTKIGLRPDRKKGKRLSTQFKHKTKIPPLYTGGLGLLHTKCVSISVTPLRTHFMTKSSIWYKTRPVQFVPHGG